MIAGAQRRPYVLILAINPVSGKGHARNQATLAGEHFAALGKQVQIIEGRDVLDFREKFVNALESKTPEGVVAFGGDGFVHEIIQQIVPRNIPLGVIPCGTGNDFARSLGIYQLPFIEQVNLIVESSHRPIDLGKVGDRWFAAILSSGFDHFSWNANIY